MASEVRLAAGELEATVLPDLGMVVSSLRHRGDELLGQRGGPQAYAERGSTFGIPILHPWANRLRDFEYTFAGTRVVIDPRSPVLHIDGDTGLAIHGVLGASPYWRAAQTADGTVTATLDFAAIPEYLAVFPFPHTLLYELTLTAGGLRAALTLTATGSVPVPISFGFHPYLTLPGTDRAQWQIAADVEGGAIDGPLGGRTFDTPFGTLDGDRPGFTVADTARAVTVTFLEGYDVAQIYAPAGAQFICFEPMTAPVDALRTGERLRSVAPGNSFTAQFEITVR